MDVNWIDLLGVGLSSGLTVKILDYLYKEYLRRSEASKSAKDLINKHIDPILKSADELVGKIRSLAQSDFRELIKIQACKESNFESCHPHLSLLFLFSQLWSRIQILRIESLFVNLGSHNKGKQLLDFFKALEATKTRLVDRSWQRGMGEALIQYGNNGIRSINYHEFVHLFRSSEEFQQWFFPLIRILEHLNHTKERQRLLSYGVILHALIDTLDNKHFVTTKRPSWGNKLTNKSRRNLKFRVFRVYLPFVQHSKSYLISPSQMSHQMD